MPTYEYACTVTSCGHHFEAVQTFTEPALTVCPVCDGGLRKVFSPVGVVFKGSGFYRTDSREANGAKKRSGSSADSSSSEESSDSSAKSDSAKSDSSKSESTKPDSAKSSDSKSSSTKSDASSSTSTAKAASS